MQKLIANFFYLYNCLYKYQVVESINGQLLLQILTAAHCVEKVASGYKAVMGIHNRGATESTAQSRQFKTVISHGGYNKNTLANDIALIKLHKPFDLNARVTLACLPPNGYEPPVGTRNCYIAGKGLRTSLRKIKNIWRPFIEP